MDTVDLVLRYIFYSRAPVSPRVLMQLSPLVTESLIYDMFRNGLVSFVTEDCPSNGHLYLLTKGYDRVHLHQTDRYASHAQAITNAIALAALILSVISLVVSR